MKNRYLLLAILVVLAAFGATLALYGSLPARMPLHWNALGEVDRYGARASAFLLPAVMAACLLLLALLPGISPRRFSVDAFSDTYWYCALLVVGLMGYVHGLALWSASGGASPVPGFLLGGMAVFFALLGNVMGKVRRNFWLGIRTPWTLANERVWYATHRLAAKTMVGASVLAFVAVLAGLRAAAMALLLAGPLVPVLYSLYYYKRLERNGALEA
jgi:uncharacterized membrane protein